MRHFKSTPRSPRAGYLLIALSILSLTLAAAVSYSRGWLALAAQDVNTATAEEQSSPQARAASVRNLSRHPSASNFSRRVGRRFKERGREESVMVGELTVGDKHERVRLRRVQEDGGERVEITRNGNAPDFTWSDKTGALSSGAPAAGDDRLIIERLAFDSPDQFILAQLRGASYYVVGRGVRADEGGRDGYDGPTYDLVRVGEPPREETVKPLSSWRVYHLNRATGLLEKIVSDEKGQKVEATLSGWVERAGESLPTHITWTREGQVVMEFNITNAAHGPKQ